MRASVYLQDERLIPNEREALNRPWGTFYARLALAAAFLSAVASRFGLWDRTVDLKHFHSFIQYTAQVLSFLPPSLAPLSAWIATLAETTIGLLLLAGVWPCAVSLSAAVLLAIFGTAMAISFGMKSPMDYSVFSASAAAVLLWQNAYRRKGDEV